MKRAKEKKITLNHFNFRWSFLFGLFLVIFSSFCFITSASAATYYVSSTDGNDTCTGLSQTAYIQGLTACPFKTLTKVNSTTFVPGDSILFKSGDTFYGSITINQSGTTVNPITFSSYGNGEKPIITGFTTISGWTETSSGSGVYYANLDVPRLNIVTLNDVLKGMGRYPNTGYLNYESHNAKVSITDDQLTGTPNWTGAELGIRKYRWVIDRHIVTDQTGGTLTYSSPTGFGQNTSYTPLNGNGYFFQNDIKCLDDLGDWSYSVSEKRIYMYFGNNNPLNYIIKAGSIDRNLTINSQSHISFTGIDFEGANLNGIYLVGATNINISDCDLIKQGRNAIYGIDSSFINITNGSITDALNDGIFFEARVNNAVIDGLVVTNVGNILGSSLSGDGAAIGVAISGDNTIVRNSNITNTGYSAISFDGDNVLVENNIIDTFCVVKDDGAGIYTYISDGAIIRNNIVLNAIGSYSGSEWSYWEPFGKAAGIYLDGGSANHNAEVSSNTVAHGEWGGIFININGGNSIINNTIFDTRYLLHFNGTTFGQIRNETITGNKFIAKATTQSTLVSDMNVNENPSLFGIFDNNYYARPIDDNLTIKTTTDGINGTVTNRTLAGWQTFSGQDANSHKSPATVTNVNDILFDYNTTISNKTVTLSQPMIDVTGAKYATSYTIPVHGSIILMPDPNPTVPDITKPVIQTFTIPTTATSLSINSITFTATDAIGVSGYKLTTTSSAPLAGDSDWTGTAPTTYTFITPGTKTLYAWVKDAAGNVSTSVSKTVVITLPVNSYILAITKQGTGAGTVTGAGTYNTGTIITASATANAGSTFTDWSGDCNANGIVTVDADKTCIATFNIIASSGGGGSSITYCSSVTYSSWSNCTSNIENRTILTKTPANCTPNSSQQLETSHTCQLATSTNPIITNQPSTTDNNETTSVTTPIVAKISSPQSSSQIAKVVTTEKGLSTKIDLNLTKRLAGRILLQVEQRGQAWYLDSISAKRYYLADGTNAYSALRQFGLGIKNSDLNKIPVGIESRFTMTDSDSDGLPDKLEEALGTNPNNVDSDGDGYPDGHELKNNYSPLGKNKLVYSESLIKRLLGRIVIQTESKGEAWYISPTDNKRYYLASGEAAYQIMRYLSLGTSDQDIRKIMVGSLK